MAVCVFARATSCRCLWSITSRLNFDKILTNEIMGSAKDPSRVQFDMRMMTFFSPGFSFTWVSELRLCLPILSALLTENKEPNTLLAYLTKSTISLLPHLRKLKLLHLKIGILLLCISIDQYKYTHKMTIKLNCIIVYYCVASKYIFLCVADKFIEKSFSPHLRRYYIRRL